MFLSSYRNMSGSLGEQEMLWEHKTEVSVSTVFSILPNFHERFYLTIRLWTQDFYRMIVNEGTARVNYCAIEIESE